MICPTSRFFSGFPSFCEQNGPGGTPGASPAERRAGGCPELLCLARESTRGEQTPGVEFGIVKGDEKPDFLLKEEPTKYAT